MIPTIQWTKEKFAEFNAKYFDGKLVTPKFKLIQSRKYVGCVSTRTSSLLDSMVLKMSTFYDLEESQLNSVLLHEMCHIYFIQDGKIHITHGPEFRLLVRTLNSKFGLSIDECRVDVNKVNPNIKRKKMVVYIGVDNSGRYAWFSSRTHRSLEGEYVCDCQIFASCISDDDMLQNRKATLTDRKYFGYYFATPLDARRFFANATQRKVVDNCAYDTLMAA